MVWSDRTKVEEPVMVKKISVASWTSILNFKFCRIVAKRLLICVLIGLGSRKCPRKVFNALLETSYSIGHSVSSGILSESIGSSL